MPPRIVWNHSVTKEEDFTSAWSATAIAVHLQYQLTAMELGILVRDSDPRLPPQHVWLWPLAPCVDENCAALPGSPRTHMANCCAEGNPFRSAAAHTHKLPEPNCNSEALSVHSSPASRSCTGCLEAEPCYRSLAPVSTPHGTAKSALKNQSLRPPLSVSRRVSFSFAVDFWFPSPQQLCLGAVHPSTGPTFASPPMRGVEKCAIQQRLPAGQSHHPFASPSMSGVETFLHGFSYHSPVEFCGHDRCVPCCSQASAHLCEVPALTPRQHTTSAPAQRAIDHSDEVIFEDHCDPMALPLCDPGSPHPYKGGSCRTLADITNFDRAGQPLLNDSVAGLERTAPKATVSLSDCFASGTPKSSLQNASCEQRPPPGPWQHGAPALGDPSLLCQGWHVGFRRPTQLGPSLPPDVQPHNTIGDSLAAGTEIPNAEPYHVHATDPASFPIFPGQPACEVCAPDQPSARDQYYHRMQAIRVAAPYTPPSHPARTGFSRPLELAGHAPEVDVNIVLPDPIHCVPFTSFDERNGPRVLAGGEDWGVQQFASFAITTAGLPGQPLGRPLGYEIVSYPSPQIALTQDRGRDHRRAIVFDFRSHGGDILVADIPPGSTLFQVFESIRDFPALAPLTNSIRGRSVLCFVNALQMWCNSSIRRGVGRPFFMGNALRLTYRLHR